MRKVQKGATVIAHFPGMMKNGTILDGPLRSTVGYGSTFPAVEEAGVGLLPGELAGEKAPPENVFGVYHRQDLLKELARYERTEAGGIHAGRWMEVSREYGGFISGFVLKRLRFDRGHRHESSPGRQTHELFCTASRHIALKRRMSGHMSRNPSAHMRKGPIGEVAGCPSCPT